MESKLSDNPATNYIGVYLKQREDMLRYYETVILVSALLSNTNQLRRLLDEYYKLLFPGVDALREQEAQEAKKLLESLKDVTFVLNKPESDVS